jgi:cell division protein FtsI/penicillin-binding protein 2
MGVLLIALGVRLVYVSSVLSPRLMTMAETQRRGGAAVPARRGMILDARGRIVALSREVPDVFVDPARVEDIDDLAARLSPRVNVAASEIVGRIRARERSRFVPVARRVDPVTAEAVEDLALQAVGLTAEDQRVYPLGASMGQVLGWVGRDGRGMGGIELGCDEHLRGTDGRHNTIRDARRRALGPGLEPSKPPVDGGHVVLTIDAIIQRIAEQALTKGVAAVEAESGVAIVLSPTTGEVLAMACEPTFDPNEPFTPETAWIRRNRAVTDPVEPGSTFKPFVACGALEGGFVSATEKIDCRMGTHRFGRRLVTDTKPRGHLDLRGIIVKSSNIGMGFIAHRMGNEVLYDTVRRFGFGRRTGIECPGECSGVVYPLRHWTTYSTTSIPIGYEILVTPLQLATAFAAIVNDGVLLKPRLIKAYLGPDGRVLRRFDQPQIVRRVVASEVSRYMARDVLVAVVEEGGGHAAKSGPFRVLGKTGTAKLANVDRSGYEDGAYLGLFVGAAPAEAPEIVVIAMVRRPDPSIGYYGGKVAAPVVGEIILKTLPYLERPTDELPSTTDL